MVIFCKTYKGSFFTLANFTMVQEVSLRHKGAMPPQEVHHGLNIHNDKKVFDPKWQKHGIQGKI